MTCPNCGADLLEGTRWCTACGEDLMPELGEPSSRSQLLQTITDRAQPVRDRVSTVAGRTPSVGLLGVAAAVLLAMSFRINSLVFSFWGAGPRGHTAVTVGAIVQLLVAALALGCAVGAWRATARLVHQERLLAQIVIGVSVFAATNAVLDALYWLNYDTTPFG
ncbi:MAG: hypothetical protein QOJ92_660 [Frankiales bacterium]|nr:hypothetical protein [Frankiales bacterium]